MSVVTHLSKWQLKIYTQMFNAIRPVLWNYAKHEIYSPRFGIRNKCNNCDCYYSIIALLTHTHNGSCFLTYCDVHKGMWIFDFYILAVFYLPQPTKCSNSGNYWSQSTHGLLICVPHFWNTKIIEKGEINVGPLAIFSWSNGQGYTPKLTSKYTDLLYKR